MILLDTNALIWLLQRHKRVRKLEERGRLYMSPASLLELKFLAESARLTLPGDSALSAIVADARWQFDEPPAGKWFDKATELSWTRDPFDRLLVAHARLRGWKLATGDTPIIDHLDAGDVLAL